MQKGLAILAIGLGVGLVMIPMAYSMFGRTADAERILDRFEFLTLGENPSRYLEQAEITRTGSAELVETAIPRLASDAAVSSSELDRLTETRFRALGTAQEKVAQANEFSVRYSKQLAAVNEKFKSVYDIPGGGLPLTATPWLLLVAGLACLIAGVFALRTASRVPVATMLALGLAMLLGPLVLSAPRKSADGEDVKDFASRGLTVKAATAAQQAAAALDELVEEADEEILPYLGRRQGISSGRLADRLGRQFPAAGQFLVEWDVIGPRLARLSDAVGESVGEFEAAKKLPISFPVWLLLAAGAALSLSTGLALAAERARRLTVPTGDDRRGAKEPAR